MNGGGLVSTEELQYLPDDIFEMHDGSVVGIKEEGNDLCYYSKGVGNIAKDDLDYVAIPPVIDGAPVTSLGADRAWLGDVCLHFLERTVIVPKGVEFIGGASFDDCSNCNLALPSTVRKIGTSAFKDCSNLSLVLPSRL